MKVIRALAIISALTLLVPAIWLLLHANLEIEPIAIIVACFLIGNAIFNGAVLWKLARLRSIKHIPTI